MSEGGGMNPPAPAPSPGGDSPGGGRTLNRTLYKCRRCKLLFWTASDASAHEASCTSAPHVNCSVCLVLRFRTDGERLEHERVCPGARPLRMADLPMADRVPAPREGEGGNDVVDLAGSDDSSVEVVETRQRVPSPVVSGRTRLTAHMTTHEEAREAFWKAARAFREGSAEGGAGTPGGAVPAASAGLVPEDDACKPAPAASDTAAAEQPSSTATAPATGFVTMWTW